MLIQTFARITEYTYLEHALVTSVLLAVAMHTLHRDHLLHSERSGGGGGLKIAVMTRRLCGCAYVCVYLLVSLFILDLDSWDSRTLGQCTIQHHRPVHDFEQTDLAEGRRGRAWGATEVKHRVGTLVRVVRGRGGRSERLDLGLLPGHEARIVVAAEEVGALDGVVRAERRVQPGPANVLTLLGAEAGLEGVGQDLADAVDG